MRFGDIGPCVEHTLCGFGWTFFFVFLNDDVLVGVVVPDGVCVAGVAIREEWAGLLLQFWW